MRKKFAVLVSNGTTYVYTSIYGNNMVLNEGICHSW